MTFIIVIAGITQFLVSLFVLSRKKSNLSNILFFFIGISSLLWAIANYLTITMLDSPNLIYIVRFILFFVVLQNASFYLFAKTFPSEHSRISPKNLTIFLLFTLAVALVTLSPFVFTSVKIEDGLAVTAAGPGIMPFMAHAAFSIFVAFKNLIKKFRAAKGISKKQFQLLIFASFLIWVIVPITNFALTPLLKTTVFITYSPLYTLAFASIIAYSIVAQRLFDIKLVAIRSVAYVMSLGVLVIGYSIVTGFFFNGRLSGQTSSTLPVAVNSVIFLAAVLVYPYIKRFFDHITNTLFYKDAYDPQTVLDTLGGRLVDEVDVNKIIQITRDTLEDTITGSEIDFILPGYGEKGLNTLKGRGLGLEVEDLEAEINELGGDLFLRDELRANSFLWRRLDRANVALVLRLKTQDQVVGYVLLEDKKSGDNYSSQDIKFLGIVADELAIAIQNALRFEEIEKFSETLQEEVDDATQRLRYTNKKLKALDETKDEFISMASHQLRTPLTSVKGYLSMVLDGDVGELNQQQKKMLTQAFTSSQHMNYLITDLLNVSRLRTGKFVIDKKPVDLSLVIDEEIGQLHEIAHAKNINLHYDKPANFPTLELDETKTRQVIMNFVDNALHYTPMGGEVRVELEAKQKSVELRVVDNGLGVPKAEQHKLFGKFFRAGNARRARPDGTGLGLFMAKKVIIAQGGAIIFKSQEGKGSTFGFTFPAK